MKSIPTIFMPLIPAGVLLVVGITIVSAQPSVITTQAKETPGKVAVVKQSQPQPAPAASQPVPTSTTSATPSKPASTTTMPAPKTTTPPSSESPYSARCGNLLSQYYSAYNIDVGVELAKHQQILSELKAAYDDGEYDVGYPADSAQPYNNYQDDITEENARWSNAIYAKLQNYNSLLRAAGCGYSV